MKIYREGKFSDEVTREQIKLIDRAIRRTERETCKFWARILKEELLKDIPELDEVIISAFHLRNREGVITGISYKPFVYLNRKDRKN